MNDLRQFTADLLSTNGGLVEDTGEGLEVLLTPDVADALGIPEHARLSFSIDREDGIYVSYESDLFKNLGRFLGNRGEFCALSLPPAPLHIERLQERLSEKVIFQNAVFQVDRSERKPISYLLAYSKYTAVSDERQEGMITAMINEFNLSVRPLQTEPYHLLSDAEEGYLKGSERQGLKRSLKPFPGPKRGW